MLLIKDVKQKSTSKTYSLYHSSFVCIFHIQKPNRRGFYSVFYYEENYIKNDIITHMSDYAWIGTIERKDYLRILKYRDEDSKKLYDIYSK
jgi:hypothetical protein